MKYHFLLIGLCLPLLCIACNGGSNNNATPLTNTNLTAKETLGQKLFFDTNLSTPPGQACASCHDPAYAFTDPDQGLPTSAGANAGIFDERHTPSAAYALYSPAFHFDNTLGGYVGGLFWDGRATTGLTMQAQGPFLDPLEMANPSPASVVEKVKVSAYADLMPQVYGETVFDNTATAYQGIADAIAAFEQTTAFHPFDSQYDQYLAGKAKLSAPAAYGLQLFNDPAKGNCAACHPSTRTADGTPPLFTDFSYANLGLPVNAAIPVGTDFDSMDVRDFGLGGRVNMPMSEQGKFKVPTLRNVALTAPYGHNGMFASLKEVVEFHNVRDVDTGRWQAPEVTDNLDPRVGNLGLTETEVDAIVVFLSSLTDAPKASRQ